MCCPDTTMQTMEKKIGALHLKDPFKKPHETTSQGTKVFFFLLSFHFGAMSHTVWGFKNGTLKPDTIPLGKHISHIPYYLLHTLAAVWGRIYFKKPQINICPLMATSECNVWSTAAYQGHKRNSEKSSQKKRKRKVKAPAFESVRGV